MAKGILNPLKIKNTVLGKEVIRRAESQLEVDYIFSELWKAQDKVNFGFDCLCSAMYWGGTPQGREFWSNLQRRYFG